MTLQAGQPGWFDNMASSLDKVAFSDTGRIKTGITAANGWALNSNSWYRVVQIGSLAITQFHLYAGPASGTMASQNVVAFNYPASVFPNGIPSDDSYLTSWERSLSSDPIYKLTWSATNVKIWNTSATSNGIDTLFTVLA